MESSQIQKDKLELIEWITQIDDSDLLNKLKAIMIEDENNSFQLSKEQQLILEEAAEKYHSKKECSYTWEEVKNNAVELKKSINEKKA
ncbi:hypothetical protein GCM10007424_12820 [Flavobacterium suaedae]|uniref:Addiction module protein n=1 Tax=Flavobacterium suaedae TaxID=1767027 RepID=A0ABQ1JPK9_9FLAO|nr:hypothetical protein [Flavobacterium suaedae]GGB74349.1 hypothetical protein GCM10007424_12820 [Flavobacterium suaedae]